MKFTLLANRDEVHIGASLAPRRTDPGGRVQGQCQTLLPRLPRSARVGAGEATLLAPEVVTVSLLAPEVATVSLLAPEVATVSFDHRPRGFNAGGEPRAGVWLVVSEEISKTSRNLSSPKW